MFFLFPSDLFSAVLVDSAARALDLVQGNWWKCSASDAEGRQKWGEKVGLGGSLSEEPPQLDLVGSTVPPKLCPAYPRRDGLCQGMVTNLGHGTVLHGCSWISCSACSPLAPTGQCSCSLADGNSVGLRRAFPGCRGVRYGLTDNHLWICKLLTQNTNPQN